VTVTVSQLDSSHDTFPTAMHVDRPTITVRGAGTADVADAVNFAREHGLLVPDVARPAAQRSGLRPTTPASADVG
jgi:hypothetical protein